MKTCFGAFFVSECVERHGLFAGETAFAVLEYKGACVYVLCARMHICVIMKVLEESWVARVKIYEGACSDTSLRVCPSMQCVFLCLSDCLCAYSFYV